MVPILYEVDPSDLDQPDRRQSHAPTPCDGDVQPAFPVVQLEGVEIGVKVGAASPTAPNLADRHPLLSDVSAIACGARYLALSQVE